MKTEQDILDMGFNEDELTFFREPSYDGCIIGISSDDRIVYSYAAMLEYLITNKICSDEEDARDFLDNDTLRAVSLTSEKSPVVLLDD